MKHKTQNFRRFADSPIRRFDSYRRGILLIELLAVLTLMTAFAVVAAGLFDVSIRALRDSRKRDAMIHGLDAALAMFRRDVWSATAFRGSDTSLELSGDSGPIVWSQASDGRLIRTVTGQSPQVWREAPAVRFSFRGALVTVSVPSGADGSEQAVFVSQRLLVQGGGR